MDNELEAETPAPTDSPSSSPVTKRRSRHPLWDLGVPLLAIGAVAGAIILVQTLRNGGDTITSSQATVANDGFTPVKLGIASSGRSGVGDTAPTFQLTDPRGTVISLADFRGKPALVNFWATWCAPCRREIPDLIKLQEGWGNSVSIIGVDLNEPGDVVADYANSMGMNYPIALDLDGSVTSAFKLTGLPETFFLDATGVIRDHRIGLLKASIAECVVAGIQRGNHDPANCR